MYLVELKTLLTVAMRQTFSSAYPLASMRGLLVSMEFPVAPQNYPSIWVDFEPVGDLEPVGIDHHEYDTSNPSAPVRHTRWRFQGNATYTVAAMASLERDTIFDEVVRVLAFGRENPGTSEFRTLIEQNDLIAANIDFDQISQRGFSASPGTPWGTDEIIYEATIAVEVFGEFVSDDATGTLVSLSSINVIEYSDQEPDPDPTW